jgi:hypothetical protein
MGQAVIGGILFVVGCGALWAMKPKKGVAVLKSDALATAVALVLTSVLSMGLGLIMVEVFSF